MLQLDHLVLAEGAFRLEADLTLPQGARCAVLGPSGAGKSTLLNAIAGFVAPEAGRMRWDGADITDLPPGQRPVTILFQDQNLFPHLTVERNLALGLSPDGRIDAAARVRIAEALARALLRARPLLLLDEPFAALGPALKAEMLALVREVADETGATVLMVTHDPQDAQRFADVTMLVAEGRAHAPVATGALFADPPPALAAYLGAG